jgi:hypothetical protein
MEMQLGAVDHPSVMPFVRRASERIGLKAPRQICRSALVGDRGTARRLGISLYCEASSAVHKLCSP